MAITKIAIIGGGISGLALLHFLKQGRRDDFDVMLYEANDYLGGNVRTFEKEGFLFETGPNGFLNNSPATLEIVEDLNLNDALIQADLLAKRRYIQIDGKLNLLPTNLISFLKSPILSNKEKLLLVKGAFNKKVSTDQSIADYVSTRFCSGVAQKLADPFIRGIFGGDINKLHMEYAFPKMKKGQMTSLTKGMGQLINCLEIKYCDFIKKSIPIRSTDDLNADYIVSTVPAYNASKIFNIKQLNEIKYCTVSVVGLGFHEASFKRRPDGFGYLIPSNQGKNILGVLIESNVYHNRAPNGHMMVRVMLPHDGSSSDLINMSLQELDSIYGIKENPKVNWVQVWPKAIPQYEMNYPAIINSIALYKENRYLTGNYIKGISFNDCVSNSKTIAHLLLNVPTKRHS